MRHSIVVTGPDDIPAKGAHEVFGQILFAKDKVEYHGQPLGLIVAESQVSLPLLLFISSSSLFCMCLLLLPLLLQPLWPCLMYGFRFFFSSSCLDHSFPLLLPVGQVSDMASFSSLLLVCSVVFLCGQTRPGHSCKRRTCAEYNADAYLDSLLRSVCRCCYSRLFIGRAYVSAG